MEPSALHNQTALYVEQDSWLYFSLGLAKAAAELCRLGESTVSQSGQAEEADDFTFFMLGLLSFSKRYGRVITQQQLQPPPEQDVLPTDNQLPARLEIRDLLR